jgi:hypothetical protein
VCNKTNIMSKAIRVLPGIIAGLVCIGIVSDNAVAEAQQYCVVCKDPDQTYVCRVDTPHANPSDKGLQLYCIIRLSKDGSHNSCAVRPGSTDACDGPVKAYAFQAPAIPPQLKSTINRMRKSREKDAEEQTLPPQKGGEPETLIDMTGRAVKASKQGLSNTGQAVGSAASSTTGKVGKAARGVGKGVTKAAGKVGSATKKTGSAVGSAAKTAYDCIKSLFKECGSKKEDTPLVSQ